MSVAVLHPSKGPEIQPVHILVARISHQILAGCGRLVCSLETCVSEGLLRFPRPLCDLAFIQECEISQAASVIICQFSRLVKAILDLAGRVSSRPLQFVRTGPLIRRPSGSLVAGPVLPFKWLKRSHYCTESDMVITRVDRWFTFPSRERLALRLDVRLDNAGHQQ